MAADDGLLRPPLTLHTSIHHDSAASSSTSSQEAPAPSNATLAPPSPSSPATRSLAGDTLRSRSNSFNSSAFSDAETARSRANSDLRSEPARFEADDVPDEELLRPDPKDKKDFDVTNNPFAYSPGQLNRLLNPKSLAVYHALGGIVGLEKGLQSDLIAGLSVDETNVTRHVSFAEAKHAAQNKDKEVHREADDSALISRHTTGQFHDRKAIFSDNRVPSKKAVSLWRMFWNAAKDKVLVLLTIAAVISLALGIYESVGAVNDEEEGPSLDWVEGVAIEVAVLIVILVTGLNDFRREKQFAALNAKKEDRQVKAVRSGKSVMISVFDVMAGDVLHLESGDSIPADGVLIESHGVRCDESSATGESDAMRKTTGPETWRRIQDGTATSKLDPFLLSGSKVLEGVGTYLVTSVGIHSSHGKIMMSLQTETEDTPLQAKLVKMANWIGYLGTSAAALLFFILLIRFLAGLPSNSATSAVKGSQFLDILIVAITIIVVAVPEGLPLAVTLALSFATKKMLRENNLVRHLRACETMGNATTICSDKTGTLTQNQMTVVAGVLSEREFTTDIKSAFAELSEPVKTLLLQSCTLNTTAFEGEDDAGNFAFIGSKTETALLMMAKEQLGMGPVAEERGGVEIVHMFPFDSDRKCMGVVVRLASGTYRLLVKGAAELMIDAASSMTCAGKSMSAATREGLESKVKRFAERSLRTIALVYRDFQQWPPSQDEVIFDDIFGDMIFLALFGIQDPLRDGVAAAVKQCQDAGVAVRMVTGDNLITATAIATQCGIKTPNGLVMEGPEFRRLSGDEMNQILPSLQVLARSSPDDKRILVERLKHCGETVAVTGDGTNDGPALKLADVGFSMGVAGTEVAKEASDIILMDDNFASIVRAIMWGRCVNDAVAKFLQFQITVNITAVVLAFVSAVSSPEMHSVLSAVQLLWVNLIMDTFAALALATDPPTPKILKRKPTPKRAPLITTNMWKMIIGQTVYQLAVTFVLYFAGSAILDYSTADTTRQTELATMVFNTFVWMQIFNQFNNRRLDNGFNIFEGIQRNPFFIGISALMIAGQVMIVFVGGAAFQIKRIDGTQWAICILCALPCLVWAMLLRCIPDVYAARSFGFAGTFWTSVYRPIAKGLRYLFGPVGRQCCVVWRAVIRFSKRIGGRKANKNNLQHGRDLEQSGEVEKSGFTADSSKRKQPASGCDQHTQPASPPDVLVSPPAIVAPPITLTEA